MAEPRHTLKTCRYKKVNTLLHRYVTTKTAYRRDLPATGLFQTLGAAIEKLRDAVLVLEHGTDSIYRDDVGRLHVGLYCSSGDDK